MKDDYIIVLDFLSAGHADSRRAEPTVQGIGKNFLNLLEVVLKEGTIVKPEDLLYIGEMKRDQVKYIKGRIGYNELTSYAKDVIVEVVSEMVSKAVNNID